MRHRIVALALVLVIAPLAGCLGETSPESTDASNLTATGTNATDNRTQTIRSEPVNGSTSDPSANGTSNASDSAPDPPQPPRTPLGFADPVQLNEPGFGFEPSVDVGPGGTVYATAARGGASDTPEQRASWLWHKPPNASGFAPLPSPAQVHEKQPAFEGDIATDAEGRLYFVDTNLVDNTLSRWSMSEEGPTWDFSRPIQGTTGVDDRPWLAAHGDGIVYYAANNGAPLPASNNLVDDTGNASRYWIYTSTDAGMTWSAGHGFANSGWCTIEASPADDQTVYVACDQALTESTVPPSMGSVDERITVFKSTDRGSSWETQPVAPLTHGLTDGYPGVAIDATGTPYAAWPDGDYGESSTTHLRYAYPGPDGAWQVNDITPFEGSFDEVWATAGSAGTLAVTFYGTHDTEPGEDTEWYAYAAITDAAATPGANWQVTKLDEDPVGTGPGSPDDFFQSAIGPEDRLHVTFDRETGNAAEVLYTVQTQGENLEPETS